MRQHSRIIETLSAECGSQSELAGLLAVNYSRVSKWKLMGIPPRHWPRLLRIAKRKNIPLTLDDLDAGSRLTRKRAA